MNRQERHKAEALSTCRIREPGDRRFARGMLMLARRDPGTVLSPRQKWLLDLLVYRYRRQLYGNERIQVPEVEPRLDHYTPRPRTRRQLAMF